MPTFPFESTNFYLNRYRFAEAVIEHAPQPDLGLVVVIPCFNEPQLIASLESLKACALPQCAVEVITVVNGGEHLTADIRRRNAQTLAEGRKWAAAHSSERLQFHFLDFQELPRKHAGVGLARKIGMDEAVRRLEWAQNPKGIIACFDADSQVQTNYFQALERHFVEHPKTPGCAIHYEHPLEGSLPSSHYEGILNYELHLRYFVHALRYAGHVHAHQTIGSSMAVRSDVYQKQGGMNRRKAGEDFYFLHKIIPLGHFSECNRTMVIPSPRRSDRVPFGTGKAIGDFIDEPTAEPYATYAFPIFEELRGFLKDVPHFYQNSSPDLDVYPSSVSDFLNHEKFTERLAEINRQSSNKATFVNRFFRWFDGFKAMKFVHQARDNFHPNQKIEEAVWALEKANPVLGIEASYSKREMLLAQRRLDKRS